MELNKEIQWQRYYYFFFDFIKKQFDFYNFIIIILDTVVGDYINKMTTTFDLNFYKYQAIKQDGYT